jgi:hypothetical protein
MSDNEPDIEDRDFNVRLAVSNIISSKQDEMFEQFDRLHRRGIHDDDVVKALRHIGEVDLLDAYAEWADIDIREDDNTTLNPVVPDPGDAPSYTGMNLTNIDGTRFRAERSAAGNWHVYKKRSAEDNGAFIGTYPTREAAASALAALEVDEA